MQSFASTIFAYGRIVLAKFSGILAVYGFYYLFFAVSTLVLIPIEVDRNVERLDRVSSAVEYLLQHGELPKEHRYNPDKDGINSMWEMELAECSDDFVPPKNDEFVIGFWQGEWWNCYAHPSGQTTAKTSTKDYLEGTAGDLIVAYSLVAFASIALALLCRILGARGAGLSPILLAIWFSLMNGFLLLEYTLIFEVSRQFVSEKEWWFVLAYGSTFSQIQDPIFASMGYIFSNFPKNVDFIFLKNILSFIGFLIVILVPLVIFVLWTFVFLISSRLVSVFLR